MSNAHERNPTATAASPRVLAEGAVEADPNSEIPGEVEERPDTPWTRLEQEIDDYVDQYELVDCEDDQGRTGDYAPNEQERLLIADAINGLLADERLLDMVCAAREFTRSTRRAEGRCEHCGAPVPKHWGDCKGTPQPSAASPPSAHPLSAEPTKQGTP